jgi:hypothetical protein
MKISTTDGEVGTVDMTNAQGRRTFESLGARDVTFSIMREMRLMKWNSNLC